MTQERRIGAEMSSEHKPRLRLVVSDGGRTRRSDELERFPGSNNNTTRKVQASSRTVICSCSAPTVTCNVIHSLSPSSSFTSHRIVLENPTSNLSGKQTRCWKRTRLERQYWSLVTASCSIRIRKTLVLMNGWVGKWTCRTPLSSEGGNVIYWWIEEYNSA